MKKRIYVTLGDLLDTISECYYYLPAGFEDVFNEILANTGENEIVDSRGVTLYDIASLKRLLLNSSDFNALYSEEEIADIFYTLNDVPVVA